MKLKIPWRKVLIRCAPHAQMLRNPRVPYPTRQLERA